MLQAALDFPRQHIDLRNPIDLVPEKLHAHGRVPVVCRENLNYIAAHTERASMKVHLVPRVLDIDQRADHLVAILLHPRPQGHHHPQIIVRAAQSIDAGDGRNDNYIPPLHKSRRSGKAQFIDLLIDRRVLGDIGVRLRYIRFRLVVIVIGYKILHCILRKELLKLAVELTCKCLVMGDNQRRFL